MLYVFGFEKVCVVLGDLYFVDPDPLKGQEGAENGVRLELRVLERGELKESIYDSTPIAVEQPIWRADFLEAVDGKPFDRTHYHPVFTGWDPGDRVFDRALSADPLAWLGDRLSDLGGLLAEAGFPPEAAAPGDAAELRRTAPEIVDATRRVLERVRAGELGTSPDPDAPLEVDGQWQLVRSGWL
ncbi:hypothetical protein [Actinokineospora bangkokensis]|uniref:Uncharacterized protein n=1 Tax=Actinokineospora bangkokensis TaxID=1193682 RepID=A0A1Q9LIM0_9PSEU|nr:hypothetical protein [Actinokineospora bangkokensis]OLR91878.1 hypothetical protein BJP25_23900 [Actinokineospora bangkokensis]